MDSQVFAIHNYLGDILCIFCYDTQLLLNHELIYINKYICIHTY